MQIIKFKLQDELTKNLRGQFLINKLAFKQN